MSTVIATMSMSLDGVVEDTSGSVRDLFAWYTAGGEATTMPGDQRAFRTSAASAKALRDVVAATGAILCGRTLFDPTNGWCGRHPAGAPIVCVTHDPPALLGAGTPLLAGVAGVVQLDDPEITPGERVTHLLFRVRTATRGGGTAEAVR